MNNLPRIKKQRRKAKTSNIIRSAEPSRSAERQAEKRLIRMIMLGGL